MTTEEEILPEGGTYGTFYMIDANALAVAELVDTNQVGFSAERGYFRPNCISAQN